MKLSKNNDNVTETALISWAV